MRYFIFFLCLFFIQHVHAQFIHEKGQELLIYGDGKQYGVVPTGENGVVFFVEAVNKESSLKRKWELINMDKNLELKWRSSFESDYNFIMSQIKYSDGYLYLMFEDSNVPMKSVFFARTSIHEGEFEFFEIVEFLPRELVGFEILGNSLFLVGMDEIGPAILKFQYGDRRPMALRGLYNENNDLLHIEVIPDNNLIQIITRMKKHSGGNYVLLLKQFDEQGEIHRDFMIESNKGHNLLDAKATIDENGDICVAGTYAYGKSKLSNGIFTMVYDGEEEQSIYYYDYVNLHNYFSYLPEKERLKMEQKYKLNKNKSKKTNYKINHQPREVRKDGDGWVYQGETVKFIENNSRIYGNMWPMEFREYSNSLILGISANGRLQWDTSFSLNELMTPSPRQQVFMNAYGDHAIVYYLHGFNLLYSIVNDEETILEQGSFTVPLSNIVNADAEEGNFGEILPWYQDTFLAFGSYINKQAVFKGQKYFYINKLSISPPEEGGK